MKVIQNRRFRNDFLQYHCHLQIISILIMDRGQQPIENQKSKIQNYLEGLMISKKQDNPQFDYLKQIRKIQKRVSSKKQIDDLGPRKKCSMCKNIFYQFEMMDHTIACIKKEMADAKANAKEKKVEKMKTQISQQKKQQSDERQKAEIIGKKQEQAKRQIQVFQEQRQRVSKIIEIQKSRIQLKVPVPQIEELIELPCPFCGRVLSLNELDHVDNCSMAVQCRHCKDKFPIELKISHLLVCPVWKRAANKPREIQKQNINHIESKRNNPEHRVPRQNIKMPQNGGQLLIGNIDPYQLDAQSRIRARQQKGVPKNILKKLKKTKFTLYENDSGIECGICLMNFQEGEMVISLSCKHAFNDQCVLQWFQNHTSCPICKKKVC